MIGDLARAEAELSSPVALDTFHARILVNLDSELILEGEYTPGDKNYIALSNSHYTIAYKPRSDQPKFSGKPFLIVLPPEIWTRRRYKDWADFYKESEHDAVLRWLIRWSNLSEEYFAMLERNKGLTFVICIDYVGYEKHLRKLYIERFGEEPTRSLLCEPYEGESAAIVNDEYKKMLYKESIRRKVEQGKNPERRNNK